jgi:DNA (cytosine-5)-methyltransferase 1
MTVRPLLLDLFCGAGGAAKGYHDAGFDVIGVDLNPMPRFPYEFFQTDAIETLGRLISGYMIGGYQLSDFAAIHASPPCQAYSAATADYRRNRGGEYPDLIPFIRERLMQTDLPWVIENVPGAPLRADFKLCGCFFGLKNLRRVRLFETNWHDGESGPTTEHRHELMAISVCGTGPPSDCRRRWQERYGRKITEEDRQQAMGGVDWMSKKELSESIPPAYTEYIGRYLFAEVLRRGIYVLAA